MRCKGCKTSYAVRKGHCWLKWGLCGICARDLHPEFYKMGLELSVSRYKQNNLKRRLSHAL